MTMHYVKNHHVKLIKTICGKLVDFLSDEDDYTGEIENVDCKDCLNDKIMSNYKKIKALKTQVKVIINMIAKLSLVFLISCTSIKGHTDKCLKWENGKCEKILNKDKHEIIF